MQRNPDELVGSGILAQPPLEETSVKALCPEIGRAHV